MISNSRLSISWVVIAYSMASEKQKLAFKPIDNHVYLCVCVTECDAASDDLLDVEKGTKGVEELQDHHSIAK